MSEAVLEKQNHDNGKRHGHTHNVNEALITYRKTCRRQLLLEMTPMSSLHHPTQTLRIQASRLRSLEHPKDRYCVERTEPAVEGDL